MKYIVLVLFIFAIILSHMGYGQNCKYDVDEKDPFTGKQQKQTSAVIGGFGPNAFRIIFQSQGGKYQARLLIVLKGKLDYYIEEGDTLFIALDGGEVIKLRAAARDLPTYQAGGGIITQYRPLYDISEEVLKKLSSTPIKVTKLSVGTNPLQFEVPAKHSDKVKKAAGCILL